MTLETGEKVKRQKGKANTMKISELKFKNDSPHFKSTFLTACIFEPEYIVDELPGGKDFYLKFVREILKKADNTETFVDMFLDDNNYYRLSAYQELLKRERPEKIWKHIRGNFGEACVKTLSDVGGLKIGNEEFSIIVPNGRGDGETRFAVLKRSEFYAERLMTLFTSVEGKIKIFSYDCGSETIKEISGKYFIYYFDGLIALVE